MHDTFNHTDSMMYIPFPSAMYITFSLTGRKGFASSPRLMSPRSNVTESQGHKYKEIFILIYAHLHHSEGLSRIVYIHPYQPNWPIV